MRGPLDIHMKMEEVVIANSEPEVCVATVTWGPVCSTLNFEKVSPRTGEQSVGAWHA